MKCNKCTNEATGIAEHYYHDGGTLYVVPLCDDCAIDYPVEFCYADDPENDRPDSVFYRLGIDNTTKLLRNYNKHASFPNIDWHGIGRDSWIPHELISESE